MCMKKFFLWSILIFLVGCSSSDKFKVTGHIGHYLKGKVLISNELTQEVDSVNVKDGIFHFQKKSKLSGFYTIKCENSGFRIFLEPGDDFKMDFDIRNIKNGDLSSISFSGDGFDNTQFMFQLYNLQLKTSIKALLLLQEDSFKTLVDENYKKILFAIDSFAKSGQINPYFLERINVMQKAQYANPYLYYIQYHKQIVPDDTTLIPTSFVSVVDDIPLNNGSYFKELTEYRYFVIRMYDYEMNMNMQKLGIRGDGLEAFKYKIDFVSGLNVPQDIKDVLGNNLLSCYSYESEDVQKLLEHSYSLIVKNRDYIRAFLEEVVKMDGLKPGNIAPAFSYIDVKGELVTLDKLKGKVVYINVWASWCGPCKIEIPYLKKLEEDFHNKNIAFVSISLDQNKEDWIKMIQEKDLHGYQLFADNAWRSSIVQDYVIRAIPRFILIDKSGKIVNVNAPRPSDSTIKKVLEDLL